MNLARATSRLAGFVCGLAMMLFSFAAGPALAGTNYVAANGVDSGSGPFATINYALTKIAGGGTIIVSNGTYVLTNTCTVSTNVTISGSTGNPADVIVDGNGLYRCFAISTNATIQNITIQNGSQTNAAINVTGGTNATLFNCTVQQNTTTNGTTSAFSCNAPGCTLNQCVFSNNFSLTNSPINVQSGVLRFTPTIAPPGICMITNCTFIGNICSNTAAGYNNAIIIFNEQASTATVFNVVGSTFIGNGSTNIANIPLIQGYNNGGAWLNYGKMLRHLTPTIWAG